MIANDRLRVKTNNLRNAQRKLLLERLVILDTSEEYLRILGVPEELLVNLKPLEEILGGPAIPTPEELANSSVTAEVLDNAAAVEAEEGEVIAMDVDVAEESEEDEYKPFELPEQYKEIDAQKKQELVELMLEHPEITELSVLIEKLKEVDKIDSQELIETATKNALKETYKGLHNLTKGMVNSALDAKMAQQLNLDIQNWLTIYDDLTIPFIKEEIKIKADMLEADLDRLPAILEKAAAFEVAYANDDLDLAKVSTADLIAGLRRFNADVELSMGTDYLKRLKAAQQVIKTYSDAAGFLFADIYDVAQKVKDFQLAQKIIADYPSNVVGTYYRGDKRYPVDLNYGGKGFEAFKPLSLEEARAKVKAWFGAADTKSPVVYYQERTKDKEYNYISVGNNIACMGYGCIGIQGADRNVYQIQIEGLKEVSATAAVLGEAPHAEQGPTLILNADTVDKATVIAVKGSENETIFFTGIDSGVQLIYKYPIINKAIEGGWV